MIAGRMALGDRKYYLREDAGMKNNIKPIETRYKGYRFRSRLEARWDYGRCSYEW